MRQELSEERLVPVSSLRALPDSQACVAVSLALSAPALSAPAAAREMLAGSTEEAIIASKRAVLESADTEGGIDRIITFPTARVLGEGSREAALVGDKQTAPVADENEQAVAQEVWPMMWAYSSRARSALFWLMLAWILPHCAC